jgi:lysozyme
MISDEALKRVTLMLEQEEGCRLRPYRDTVGKLTIGVGRNLDSQGITRQEALYLLQNDIKESVEDLERLDFFSGLTDVRKVVLVDMCFNLGLGGLMGFRKMIAAIRAGNFEAAATEIRGSAAAEQTGGARYAKLAYLMEKGEW